MDEGTYPQRRKRSLRLGRVPSSLAESAKLNADIRLTKPARAVADKELFPSLPLVGYKRNAKLAICDMLIANVLHRHRGGKVVRASRCKANLSNHRVQLDAQNALVMGGLLRMAVGTYDATCQMGYETRFTPLGPLLAAFEQLADAPLVAYRPGEMIVLKDAAKATIPIPDELSPEVAGYLADRECLIAIFNRVNGRHECRYRVWDPVAAALSDRRGRALTALKAIYNNGSFDEGGRLYGDYQNLRKAERRTLTIDGQPTVELDYRCLHPAMLYNEEGLRAPPDSYAVFPRQTKTLRRGVKIAFNAMLNARSPAAAIGACNLALSDRDKKGRLKPLPDLTAARALKRELTERNLNMRQILEALRKKHAAISKYFGTGYGIHLQNQDVELVYRVCGHFCGKGVPCLPIHDSFIVPADYLAELRSTMQLAYVERHGFEPTVR